MSEVRTWNPDLKFIVAGKSLHPALSRGEGLEVDSKLRPSPGAKAVLVPGKGRARVGIYREEDGAAFLDSLDPTHAPLSLGNAAAAKVFKVVGIAYRPLHDYFKGAPKAYAV